MTETAVQMVTVIMPIRNERAFIERSLGAVLAQDYPPEAVQVVVVDGLSDDGTPDEVRRVMADHPGRRILLLDNPARIVPAAFNRGLAHADGAYIVRVDGHCIIEPDYVRRCVENLQLRDAQNVGGLQRAEGEGYISRAVAAATSSPFGVGNARFHYTEEPGWADTVYLGAWPRTVFDRIGGFDEELVRNQDDEFNFRLTQAGGRIWLDPAIRSTYFNRPSLRKLWRQYFQYGFYKVRVIQKRGAVPSWRHLVPATFVAALTGTILIALLAQDGRWLLPVAVPYLAANLLASAWTARRSWSLLPVLPVTYAILHAAYGTGFLWGLWRWRRHFGSPVTQPVGAL